MPRLDATGPGVFCWLDVAASDAALAKAVYLQALSWNFENPPMIVRYPSRCRRGGREVGSLYALKPGQLERGVPSRGTPYRRVDSVDTTAQHIAILGRRLVVAPFDAQGTARIAVIEDAVGALVRLWQPI